MIFPPVGKGNSCVDSSSTVNHGQSRDLTNAIQFNKRKAFCFGGHDQISCFGTPHPHSIVAHCRSAREVVAKLAVEGQNSPYACRTRNELGPSCFFVDASQKAVAEQARMATGAQATHPGSQLLTVATTFPLLFCGCYS